MERRSKREIFGVKQEYEKNMEYTINSGKFETVDERKGERKTGDGGGVIHRIDE